MARVTEHGDIRFLQGFAQALAKVADGIEGIRAGEPDAQ